MRSDLDMLSSKLAGSLPLLLLCVVCVAGSGSSSFSDYNLLRKSHEKNVVTKRPKFPIVPSDSLPVNLNEKPDKKHDPRAENLKPEILRKLLGRFFIDEFMSVERPKESITKPNGTLALRFQRGYPVGRRPPFLARFGRINLKDETGRRFRQLDLKVKTEAKRKVAKFIRTYTYCPVIYTWKDLGIRFWPRWIKEGQCHQRGRSCSLPPGMRCKPSYSQTIILLRFHCWPDAKICNWIHAQYPIISACKCKC
ncbi:noggin-2-like [Octopus sinensis]|uniref:Noggin-2-like n=1 Tax=Octopus sinensis TaxID=2607531 RepID=A0A6P7TZD7_9MOLL|nr:noggin-2-like [Octopus sinensis]